MSTSPSTPLSAVSPNCEATPNSHRTGYPKASRAVGEQLACLVGASFTAVGEVVYVFGGFDQYSDEVFNTLYKLACDDDDQYRWTKILTKGRIPSKRHGHSATLWRKDKLIVFGGNGEEEDRYYGDLAVLHLDTMTWWHPEIATAPEGRIKHSATVYDDKLYIAGGLEHDKYAETLLVLDLLTWEWQIPIPFVRRFQHITFMYNKRLYLFGGFHEDMSRSNHLSFIDVERHTVTHLEIDSPSAPPMTGHLFSQICGDQLVVVVTDTFSQTSVHTGLWHLDLASMQWQHHEILIPNEDCNWHYFTMAEHDTSFYLFGAVEQEPDEYYAMVLHVDLKEYGIVPIPPPQLGTDLVVLLHQSQTGQHGADFSIRSSIDPDAGELRVHRLVLLARWPHFANVINSGMTESTTNVLTLPEPFSALKAFVWFLYTDALDEALSPLLIADLLVMADLYLLPRLLALCVRKLHSYMDIESVGKIYQCASHAGQNGLRQTALHFIFQHFGAVSRTSSFRDMPQQVFFQLLEEIPDNAAIMIQPDNDYRLCPNTDNNNDSDDAVANDEDDHSPMDI
ncbi:hypothetical protein DFQ28_001097 [Apophysomyces sp. BC1034]|nr:hypothetical protein DFQ30_001308 [Apophysomyces sp. BC1015]KAG0180475.1 hypothetical protein DFQ29_000620 [Apophysomyces sp. BC1021]KAG0191020.1 hypothetical protein DFQ28_001097 [Apophysomyces sp. BC1034]